MIEDQRLKYFLDNKETFWITEQRPCPVVHYNVADNTVLTEIAAELGDFKNVYMCLYLDGTYYNPDHIDYVSHKELPINRRIIIYSLGDTRTLVYKDNGKEVKRIELSGVYIPDEEFHWDKGYTHGIPKEENKKPRIGMIFYNE